MLQENRWQSLKAKIRLRVFRLRNFREKKFECPVCAYNGPFMHITPSTGYRRYAKCPNCGAMERHRFQFLVVKDILNSMDTASLKMLHFSPEPFFRDFFSKKFGQYETADLKMKDVDYHVDLQQLPFADQSYDFIFASHVLEYIPHDEKAISEIRRILRPNGIAVLPVPVFSEKTVEYPKFTWDNHYHVRAPGLDYFERYERYFSRVEKIHPDLLPEKYQLFVYEDRSKWPTQKFPWRPPNYGEKHVQIVPVCYA
jgi:SAM-dependent methyltransferase